MDEKDPNTTPTESVEKPFFATDSCGDTTTFATLGLAKQHAEDSLDEERDAAVEGWSEDVHQITYGRIIGLVVETERRPRNDDDVNLPKEFTEVLDYGRKPVNDLNEFDILTDAIGCARSFKADNPNRAAQLDSLIAGLKKLRKAST